MPKAVRMRGPMLALCIASLPTVFLFLPITACRKIEVYGEGDAGDAGKDAAREAGTTASSAPTNLLRNAADGGTHGSVDGSVGVSVDAGLSDGGVPADVRAVDTLPPPNHEELLVRMKHLVDAMREREPDLARDIVLPRNAYISMYDAKNPGLVWEKKVFGPITKSLKRESKRIQGGRLIRVELGQVARLEVKEGEWKQPPWQAKGTRLVLEFDGRKGVTRRELKIAELLSYRGVWYVSKLR
jgi:hypothetical protein